MKNLHIENSFKIWDTRKMRYHIFSVFNRNYNETDVEFYMGRSYKGMYVEWWLHNLGYYITLPFVKVEKIRIWNERCKHVDLEEHFNC